MSLRFEHPEWLLVALVALPMAFAALRWFSSMSVVRRWSAAILRVVLIALITGILAGATAVRSTERLAVIAVIDVSGSVERFYSPPRSDLAPEDLARRTGNTGSPVGFSGILNYARDFLALATANRKPDDLLGVVLFDGQAAAVLAPTRADALDQLPALSLDEGTNIEEALRLAAAMIPPDASGRLVLFSDGVETDGDAIAAAQDLASRASGSRGGTATSSSTLATPSDRASDQTRRVNSIPIDIAPLAYAVEREVYVESVDAPPVAPDGSTITVRVVLETAGRASDASPSRGTLELLREGQPLDINGEAPLTGRALTLAPGRHVELITLRLPKGRLHRFDAVFIPDTPSDTPGGSGSGRTVPPQPFDTIAANNRAQAFTFTPGGGAVLIVSDALAADVSPDDTTTGALPAALRSAGLDVSVISSDAFPADPLPIQAYDLVILNNVPADALSKQSQENLAAYVAEQGGGLVMVGGRQSFGAGGWKGTPIEPILPVRLDLPEKTIVPAVAIAFVLDNSGSMGRRVMGSTRTQQFIANEGAAIAVRTLDKSDLISVITFNNRHEVLIPIGKNAEPDRAADAIRSIRPDGGTNIPPALEAAGQQLAGVTADFKHIILLTDGRSQSRESLPGVAARLKQQGIHVTAIGVGDDCDENTLRTLAQEGDGAFYHVTDPNTLPRVFVKAVRVVRSPMVREAPFTPVVLATGSPITERLPAPPPSLGGISLTQPSPDPLVTTAILHPAGEPVFAHWNVGLGRVAAFTSDAASWSANWIPTPTYNQFWTDLARSISRPPTDRSQELTIETVGSDLHIRLDATGDGGTPLDLLSVSGHVYSAASGEGARVPIVLSQTGPGVYETTVRAPASGNHVVTLAPKLGNKSLAPIVGGVSRASGLEFRRMESNVALLDELARTTGGRVLDLASPTAVRLFDRAGIVPTEARLPLWRTLLLWAIVVLMLDIGTRRIAWDRLVSREFGASMKAEAQAAMTSRASEAQRVLTQLRTSETARENERASGPAPAALSAEDARNIVRAEAERRRAAREARRVGADPAADTSAQNSTPAAAGRAPARREPAPKRPADTESTAAPAPDATPPAEGGLFAAKKRARDRINREQDE